MHHTDVNRGRITGCSCYDARDQDVAAIHGRDAMKLPRVSIARLMVIVAIIALNIAATRAFMRWEWSGLFLIGLALQVGLLGLIRCRIGSRAFWWGFEAFGLASALFVPCMVWLDPYGHSDLSRVVRLYAESAFIIAEHLCTLVKDPASRARL